MYLFQRMLPKIIGGKPSSSTIEVVSNASMVLSFSSLESYIFCNTKNFTIEKARLGMSTDHFCAATLSPYPNNIQAEKRCSVPLATVAGDKGAANSGCGLKCHQRCDVHCVQGSHRYASLYDLFGPAQYRFPNLDQFPVQSFAADPVYRGIEGLFGQVPITSPSAQG
jgi:hypothetical protein